MVSSSTRKCHWDTKLVENGCRPERLQISAYVRHYIAVVVENDVVNCPLYRELVENDYASQYDYASQFFFVLRAGATVAQSWWRMVCTQNRYRSMQIGVLRYRRQYGDIYVVGRHYCHTIHEDYCGHLPAWHPLIY